jgi:hypothetical protein
MTKAISALIAAAVIVGSASVASAGGYSSNPQTRRLELLADRYNGGAEYIHPKQNRVGVNTNTQAALRFQDQFDVGY